MDLRKLVEELNEKIYDEKDVNEFYHSFVYTTDGYNEFVEFHIDDSIVELLNSEESHRGWDDDKYDYERTEEEQILYELKIFQERLNKIVSKLEMEKINDEKQLILDFCNENKLKIWNISHSPILNKYVLTLNNGDCFLLDSKNIKDQLMAINFKGENNE